MSTGVPSVETSSDVTVFSSFIGAKKPKDFDPQVLLQKDEGFLLRRDMAKIANASRIITAFVTQLFTFTTVFTAVERMLDLTAVSDHEDVYSTYDRIDGIAGLFEVCGDPWGLL